LEYLIHLVSLSVAAKLRHDEISLAVDEAPFDDRTGHVNIGFKRCGKESIDTIMKWRIFNEDSHGPNLQSDKLCFPLAIFLEIENKAIYDKYVWNIFEDVEKIRNEGIPECEGIAFRITNRKI
jgi:hypothetical protein